MASLTRELPTAFILTVLVATLLFPTVRSNPNPLSHLSTDRIRDLCPSSSDLDSRAACNIRCFRADPVCGEDNVTYWCGCPDAHCHGVRVKKLGAC